MEMQRFPGHGEGAMRVASDREIIIDNLRRRPSVASAIAIGHYHVLNGAPFAAALKGLHALEEMPCDWTVTILDHTITDSTRRPIVRQPASGQTIHALTH